MPARSVAPAHGKDGPARVPRGHGESRLAVLPRLKGPFRGGPFLPLPLRLIGLFHLALPPYLIWLIFRLGYHSKAWIVQVLLTWAIALVTWLVTSPLININFVFSYLKYDHLKMGALPFFLLGFLAVFVAIGATHLLLRAIFNRFSR